MIINCAEVAVEKKDIVIEHLFSLEPGVKPLPGTHELPRSKLTGQKLMNVFFSLKIRLSW